MTDNKIKQQTRRRAYEGFGGQMRGIATKKDLGQNFLFDETSLDQIVDYGQLTTSDAVLEIGPGMGPLTARLLKEAGCVVAVEFDKNLASQLRDNVEKIFSKINHITWLTPAAPTPTANGGNLRRVASADRVWGQFSQRLHIINADFLSFDLNTMPANYKVVANIPYNITSKIIEKLWTAENKPERAVLLVQKEVAERLAAGPGQLSVLAIAAQIFSEIKLGIKVPAELFVPAPKVDSQVVIMRRRAEPLVPADKLDQFFYIVKAGFSEKRKKLRSSLAVGLRTSKIEAERLLAEAGIDPNKRAQELTIDEWKRLARL